LRVKDAHVAYDRALELGAQPIEIPTGPMELRLPAIKGIGGAPLYLIDRFEDDYPQAAAPPPPEGSGRLRAAGRRPAAARSTTSTSSSSTARTATRRATA
jgi:Hydroxyphenylpyruvate dioxygenase, HPPD, N-terminal